MGIRPPSPWFRRIGQVTLSVTAAWALAPALPVGSTLGPMGITLVIAFLVLSVALHEAAHAWVADRCGDSTARELGRLTINPIAHIDLWMTIIIPASLALMHGPIFGGAKPVPVAYHRLRHPLRDMALVALAGPASNFLIAIVFMIAWKLCIIYGGYEENSLMIQVLVASMSTNILLTAFNLLPIPPLDGSRVMAWILPSSLRPGYVALERFGLLLVFATLFVPPVQRTVLQMGQGIFRLIDGLTSGIG